jgi:hypothetical protein
MGRRWAVSEGPLTAEQLMVRWHIDGPTLAARRKALQRRCQAWGLRPMTGTRGPRALYRPADVDRAEARAAGSRL